MALWIKEVGYPVLTVAEEVDGIGIEQSRFISTGAPAHHPQNQTNSQATQNQKKTKISGGSLSA